jgi:L-lactate dehydrogenase complex protein LldE
MKTGADYVVSVDISCLMHVGGILQRTPEAKHIKPIHIAEVLVAGW